MFAFGPTFVPTYEQLQQQQAWVQWFQTRNAWLQLQEQQARVQESSGKSWAAWVWGDEDEAPVKLSETLLREKGLKKPSETASTAASTDHDTATTCSDDALRAPLRLKELPHLAEDYEVEKTFVTVRPASGARKRELSCPARPRNASKEKTVMWRNLPCTRECDRDFLLSKLEFFDFFRYITFFNLKMDYRTNKNCGYAFLVFSDRYAADKFSDDDTQSKLAHMLGKVEKTQPLQVNDATLKGLDANIAWYRNDAVMRMKEEWRPVLLENGVRRPLPPPTERLRKLAAPKGQRGQH